MFESLEKEDAIQSLEGTLRRFGLDSNDGEVSARMQLLRSGYSTAPDIRLFEEVLDKLAIYFENKKEGRTKLAVAKLVFEELQAGHKWQAIAHRHYSAVLEAFAHDPIDKKERIARLSPLGKREAIESECRNYVHQYFEYAHVMGVTDSVLKYLKNEKPAGMTDEKWMSVPALSLLQIKTLYKAYNEDGKTRGVSFLTTLATLGGNSRP
jgi:hypothetical protein